MNHHSIVVACRDSSEGERIRSALGEPSIPLFRKSGAVLVHAETTPDAFIVMTPLLTDENAFGLLTKLAILQPMYAIVYACQCDKALNILRLFGCGASAVIGEDELDLLKVLVQPQEEVLNHLVMAPFFIDDDVSNLKKPPLQSAQMLHVTFLGAQALMSFSNAVLNIEVSELMSFSCLSPRSVWANQKIQEQLGVCTNWTYMPRPAIGGGSVTLCQNMNQLASLEPTGQHFVVCHGYVSESERAYIDRLPPGVRLFVASNEGYREQSGSGVASIISPERLWDVFISALYKE